MPTTKQALKDLASQTAAAVLVGGRQILVDALAQAAQPAAAELAEAYKALGVERDCRRSLLAALLNLKEHVEPTFWEYRAAHVVAEAEALERGGR